MDSWYTSVELWLTRQSHLCLWIHPDFFLADPHMVLSSPDGSVTNMRTSGAVSTCGTCPSGGNTTATTSGALRATTSHPSVLSNRWNMKFGPAQTVTTGPELLVTCSHKTHWEYEKQKVGKQVEINRTFQTRKKNSNPATFFMSK